jgi:hypothetical protein
MSWWQRLVLNGRRFTDFDYEALRGKKAKAAACMNEMMRETEVQVDALAP